MILGFQIPQSTEQGFREKERGPEKAKHLEPGRGKALKGPRGCCKLCSCYIVALRAFTFMGAHAKAQKLSSWHGWGYRGLGAEICPEASACDIGDPDEPFLLLRVMEEPD